MMMTKIKLPTPTDNAREKEARAFPTRTKIEIGDEYDLWPAMAKAGYDRLTQANIEAFKKGLKP